MFRKKISKKKTEKPPKTFIVIFGIFVLLASINLINDIGTFGAIKPFGFIDNAWAAVRKITGIPAPNGEEIARRLIPNPDLSESIDRCEIIDPNLAEVLTPEVYRTLLSLTPKGENPGGLNQAIVLDGGAGGVGAQIAAAKKFGFSYILGMVTSPNGTTGAIDFVNQSLAQDLIPVVRLCYANVAGCDPYFKEQNNIVEFYTTIAKSVNGQFIAMVGPNEPGTGDNGAEGARKELFGFVDEGELIGAYNELVLETDAIASSLQNLRGQGLLLLSPGAFNLTNSESNDVVNMLYEGETLDLSLYDVLMGNTYEVGNRTSYDYYENSATGNPGQSLKSKVDEAGGELKTIITEFGVIKEPGKNINDLVGAATNSFNQFCEDENVEGIMFFRAVQGLPETQAIHELTDPQINQITANCSTSTELPDYAWANCPLDTKTYADEYDRKSTAQVCGIDEEADLGAGYYLRVQCEGDSCTTKKQNTVSVLMPIRHFGSISASGAPFFDYTPISVDVGARFDALISRDPDDDTTVINDTFNQFAGKLVSGSKEYPMPWLGNAINTSSQLIKADPILLTDPEVIEFGIMSSVGGTLTEKQADIQLSLENPPAYATSEFQEIQEVYQELEIDDERALCLVNSKFAGILCEDTKHSLSIEELRRRYRPYDVVASYKKPEQCSSTDLLIRNEPYNYIEGPEIKTGSVVETSMTAANICTEFVGRATGTNTSPLFYFEDEEGITCTYNDGKILETISKIDGSPMSCGDLKTETFGVVSGIFTDLTPYKNCSNGTGTAFDPAVTIPGNCDISPEVSICYDIATEQATELNSEGDEETIGEVYLIQEPSASAYADVDDYDIPGIYDSLYWMYKRNAASMSTLGKRLVAKDNVGWEVQVSSNVRDANREINKSSDFKNAGEAELEYKYATDTNSSDIFKNEYYFAKGDSNQVENHYYDWLGYVDILQEIQTVFTNSRLFKNTTSIESEEFWADSSVSLGSLSEELIIKQYLDDVPLLINAEKELIIAQAKVDTSAYFSDYDLALKNLRYPMYTCDTILRAQMEYLQVTGTDLSNLTVSQIQKLVEDNDLPDPSCISLSDPKNNVVWREDKLAQFLCEQGYTDVCYTLGNEVQCNVVPTDPVDTGTDPDTDEETDAEEEEPFIPDSETGFILPVQGGTKTAMYGYDRGSSYHAGQDYGIASGSEVQAIGDGVVKYSGIDKDPIIQYKVDGQDSGPYGYVVKIEHPNGLISLYAHNSQLLVSTGEQVQQGQVIALSGSTGRSSGPHLHLEIRRSCDYWDGNQKSQWKKRADGSGAEGPCTLDPNVYIEGIVTPFYGEGSTPPGQQGNSVVCIDQNPDLSDDFLNTSSNSCNEFNCFRADVEGFETSLACAAATLRSSIYGSAKTGGPPYDLAETLDSYGPFCDNETRRDDSGNPLESLPFTYNWTGIYDDIAVNAPRSCSERPPNQSQSAAYSFTAECTGLPSRKENNPDAWEFFRGALETCTLTNDEMTWAGSTGGKDVDTILREVLDANVQYLGQSLNNAPDDKIKLVIEQARAKQVNPYMLIAIWGTESAFGQSNPACNVFKGQTPSGTGDLVQ